jgi:hypothetical protein
LTHLFFAENPAQPVRRGGNGKNTAPSGLMLAWRARFSKLTPRFSFRVQSAIIREQLYIWGIFS